MFFTLRYHLEQRKDCSFKFCTPGPVSIVLGERESNLLKRCCSLCSIGQLYTKHPRNAEDLDLVVAPQRRGIVNNGAEGADNENQAQAPAQAPEILEGAEGFSPTAGQTRGKRGETGFVPLSQAVGNDGLVMIKIPFTIIDLNI